MAEGLVWLALLVAFVGLASAGWVEYRKVESYRSWAQSFERSKYDIYAVLGQREQTLTWGKPTPRGPVDLQNCEISDIETVQVLVDGQPVNFEDYPSHRKLVQLQLLRQGKNQTVLIPFTEVTLAVEWAQYLKKLCQP